MRAGLRGEVCGGGVQKAIKQCSCLGFTVLLITLLLSCGPKHQGKGVPSADALFEGAIAASGGREAMMAHDNVISRGRVYSPAQSSQMVLTVYHEAPQSLYTTLEVPGIGVIASGYSDGLAWELNPLMGPRLLSGDEAAAEARRADFYATLNYATHYPQRSVIGQGVFAEAEVWEVEAVTTLGDTETLYFDKGTGLLRGSTVVYRTDGGAMTSTTTFREHREIDGILLPVVMEQDAGGVEMIITLDDVHYDVETMPSLAPPPVVLELVER